MGIIIGKTGCGYGYLAWKEMIRILLLKKRMRKVTAGVMASNKPMIKIFRDKLDDLFESSLLDAVKRVK